MTPFQLGCRDRDRAGRFARAQALKLGVGLADVLGATPGQLHALAFYPRDKEGDLKVPAPSAPPPPVERTYERDRARVESFRPLLRPEKYAQALERLEAFWAKKREQPDG